jgi:hypothetical protein
MAENERHASTENSEGTVAGRIQNLKPWKPGQSGNPGGRPRRDLAAEIARAIFERDPEAIERAFLAQLRKGNSKVFTALADRAYGKPRLGVDLTGSEGETSPTILRVVFVNSEGEEQGKF